MEEQDIVSLIKMHRGNDCWLDFSVYLYDKGRLIIVGSFDLSYYHQLEIIAENPSYVSGEMTWHADLQSDFIQANNGLDITESKAIKKLDFYSDDQLAFSVVADKFSVNFDTVFYYHREPLGENQRLAHWLT